jgi:hypothetical protein
MYAFTPARPQPQSKLYVYLSTTNASTAHRYYNFDAGLLAHHHDHDHAGFSLLYLLLLFSLILYIRHFENSDVKKDLSRREPRIQQTQKIAC